MIPNPTQLSNLSIICVSFKLKVVQELTTQSARTPARTNMSPLVYLQELI
ncbi:uncharacterized protein METZ01_LOCUS219177, partial [marine metagenome]